MEIMTILRRFTLLEISCAIYQKWVILYSYKW